MLIFLSGPEVTLFVSKLGLVIALLCFLIYKTSMLGEISSSRFFFFKVAEVTFIHAETQGIKQWLALSAVDLLFSTHLPRT